MVDLERRLREYGAELIANERPVEKTEVQRIARAEIDSGPVTTLDVFDPSDADRRRPVPWKVALVAAAAALTLFIPFLFDTSSDDPAVVTDPRREVPTTLEMPEEMKSEQFVRRSVYGVGDVYWYETPTWVPSSSIAYTDGVYQARRMNGEWFMSSDGYQWNPSDSTLGLSSDSVPSEASYSVFAVSKATWLALVDRSDDSRTLSRWVGGRWVERPFTEPTVPYGITFGAPTTLSASSLSYVDRYLGTSAVLSDRHWITVPHPSWGNAQMVVSGDYVYAFSLDETQTTDGLRLWRTEYDGQQWHNLTKPDLAPGGMQWVALTAGHDRVMLTVGEGSEDEATQVVWTTTDGEHWEQVDVGVAFDTPAPPQPTEFGWMMTTIGDARYGSWEMAQFRLLLSADGFEWENAMVPGKPPGLVGGPPLPVTYQAGLFFRDLSYIRDYSLVGRLID